MNNFEQITYYQVRHSVVESLIQSSLNCNYVIVEGWANDSSYTYNIDDNRLKWYKDHYREEVEAYLRGTGHIPYLDRLLCELVVRGVIKKGRYLITCSY